MNDSRRAPPSVVALLAATLLVLAATATVWLLWPGDERASQAMAGDAPPPADLPWPRPDAGFITSQGCRQCHAAQYDSWHATYHRTMTQPLTNATARADFDNVSLELRGHEYRLSHEGDKFWADVPDLDYSDLSKPPKGRVKRELVMSTGSHHLQAFWMTMGEGNLLRSLPFMYKLADQRWIPVDDSVLGPPGNFGENSNVWNDVCSRCHAVAAIPNVNAQITSAETRVAEIGIACEACHGPGEKHAERHRLATAKDSTAKEPDPTIILPTTCDHRVSAQICGQCHSLFTYKQTREQERTRGYCFRAGGQLADDRVVVRPEDRYSDTESRRIVNEYFNDQSGGERSEFWDDGTPRITGREYNGLLETACFQRGELSCVSCHSMHDSNPDDQIAAKMETNQACLQCHKQFAEQLSAHTHHAAGSSGSQCYNCHMPNTSFGLFAFSRSHKIDSPSVSSELQSGRPDACVLCHLDQTMSWAAKNLSTWYGQSEPKLDEQQSTVSAAILYGLRGDACQRALIAWHMRWEPARAVSGSTWLAPTIAQLLVDPYAAVRYQAGQTMKTLPGLEKLSYDFIAPAEFRELRRQQAIQIWDQQGTGADRRGARVLLEADGKLMRRRVQQLLDERDNRLMQCIN